MEKIEKLQALKAAKEKMRWNVADIIGYVNDPTENNVEMTFKFELKNLNTDQICAIRKLIENGITWRHSGKMQDIASFSTCTLLNTFCNKMRNGSNDTICPHCYADTLLKMRFNLALKAANNTAVIDEYIYPTECFPYINAAVFRFNSFGELNSYIECVNYFRWAAKNPHCTFALWTKRADIIRHAETIEKRPLNLNIIYSNPLMNDLKKSANINDLHAVFNVFTDPNEKQNCPKQCIDCLKCYTPHKYGSDPLIIIEKLK